MQENKLDWSKTQQLSIPQILLAVFGPSAVAFTGFHLVLPRMVAAGTPPLIAWPLVAGVMLAILVALALALLVRDARQSGVSLKTRLCLNRVSGRQWILYVALALLVLAGSALIQPMLPAIWQSIGFQPPSYYPFFLRGIDPAATPPDQLSPGLPLYHAYWMLPLMAIVLALNILAEDLYFRAWLLPKMSWMGKASWIVNGLLFAFYHTFQLWLLPILLLASFGFAFVVWHSKSVIPSLALHFVLNFLFGMLGMLGLILGVTAK
ncbi:MAG: CPBP family intramembrane metalloprotease [Sideroxydans sp.]|nr:CPBP family intramembrane metalloprotease [Sideroxydans sp.]